MVPTEQDLRISDVEDRCEGSSSGVTTRELNLLDRTSIAMHYIDRISDQAEKNEAIKDLTKQLYTQLPQQSNTEKSSS